jgi:hypothetical protein
MQSQFCTKYLTKRKKTSHSATTLQRVAVTLLVGLRMIFYEKLEDCRIMR